MKILKWMSLETVLSNFLRKLRFWAEFRQERMITWDAEEDGMTVNTREIELLNKG